MTLEKIFEKVGNVKLRGGIFGKMTWAIVVICICATVLAISAGSIYLTGATILFMMFFAIYFFRRLLDFAEKNPQIAILDGAEFLAHEQILHAAKGGLLIPVQPNVIDHAQPELNADSSDLDSLNSQNLIEGS